MFDKYSDTDNISGNGIGEKGAESIAKSLKVNKSLTSKNEMIKIVKRIR